MERARSPKHSPCVAACSLSHAALVVACVRVRVVDSTFLCAMGNSQLVASPRCEEGTAFVVATRGIVRFSHSTHIAPPPPSSDASMGLPVSRRDIHTRRCCSSGHSARMERSVSPLAASPVSACKSCSCAFRRGVPAPTTKFRAQAGLRTASSLLRARMGTCRATLQ